MTDSESEQMLIDEIESFREAERQLLGDEATQLLKSLDRLAFTQVAAAIRDSLVGRPFEEIIGELFRRRFRRPP